MEEHVESELTTKQELLEALAYHEDKVAGLKEMLARYHGPPPSEPEPKPKSKWPLEEEEYERYGRQLILPTIGMKGQLRIKSASVLIIGLGGLGCPAAAYLGGAGVGTIGLLDDDLVEASNLHRQIAHATSRVGQPKVDSARAYLADLNPLCRTVAHRVRLSPDNAEDIIRDYDVVLDCTDNPATRYLISDACVLLQKPLVSASALKTDGQLVVLNSPPAPRGDRSGGPCYRCIWPKAMADGAQQSCVEAGVLGPVVGVMGALQALEALRLIADGKHLPPPPPPNQELHGAAGPSELQDLVSPVVAVPKPTLHQFYAAPVDGSAPRLSNYKVRSRHPNCVACGAGSALTKDRLRAGLVNYVQLCGADDAPVFLLPPEERVSPADFHRVHEKKQAKAADKARANAALRRAQLSSGKKIAAAIRGGSGYEDEGEGEAYPVDETEDDDEYKDSNLLIDIREPTPFEIASRKKGPHILLDVREKEHFEIARIPGAVNLPFSKTGLPSTPDGLLAQQQQLVPVSPSPTLCEEEDVSASVSGASRAPSWLPENIADSEAPIYVVCRQGNDSQIVVQHLKDLGLGRGGERFIADIRGGMRAWKKEVEGTMPFF